MEKYFKSNDGVMIPYISYENNNKKKVIILHDYFEHIERYDEIADLISQNGFDSYVLEYRGHGKLANDSILDFGKGGINQVLTDIKLFIKHNFSNVNYGDIIFIGQGLGALISTYLLENYPFKNAILISMQLDKRFSLFMGYNITKIENKLGFKKSIFNNLNSILNREFKKEKESEKLAWITRDKEEIEKIKNDDKILRAGSPSCFMDIISLTRNVKKNILKIREFTNIYIIYGTKDPLVLESKLKKYMQKLNTGFRKIKLLKINNGRHLALHEINRDLVLKEIIRFAKEVK